MISVKEAERMIAEYPADISVESVDLFDAPGRVLAEDISADRNFPPFDRVMMDGIALNYRSWNKGNRTFSVQETAGAGSPQARLTDQDHCIEIMTGAILPENTDAVVPYEEITMNDGVATVRSDVRPWQNIHRQGTDRKAGDIIIPSGRRIGAAETGIMASVGKSTASVLRKMRIATVSTGDELVPVEDTPEPYQIRRSNTTAVAALLDDYPVVLDDHHLRDDSQSIRVALGTLLEERDALIISGGVSKGKYDFLPEALSDLGVEKHFHRIAQRPGKPMWFGTHPSGCAVFALPGNPVSTFMTTVRYVIPWIRQSTGLKQQVGKAILGEAFDFSRDLTYFLQVKVKTDDEGRTIAMPSAGKGSGDHANLVEISGFLELPSHRDRFTEGTWYPYWSFRREF